MPNSPLPHTSTSTTAEPNVRTRLFLVAERLAGSMSLEGVSVRDIAQEANASLSAVNYHFGSKIGLLRHILITRLDELGAARQDEFAALEAAPNVTVRGILEMWFRPVITWSFDDAGRASTIQFLSRAQTTPIAELQEVWLSGIPVVARLTKLMLRAAPHVCAKDMYWRIHFTMGVEHMNHWDMERLNALTGGTAGHTDKEEIFKQLIAYCEAAILR